MLQLSEEYWLHLNCLVVYYFPFLQIVCPRLELISLVTHCLAGCFNFLFLLGRFTALGQQLLFLEETCFLPF